MASVTRKAAGGGRTARREELREKLLAATEALLQDGESFTELSVERLVSAAGVSRSTFYVYFEDKGQLLRAWFDGISSGLEEDVEAWWRLDAGSTREDVRAALAGVVEGYRPHTRLMAALYDTAAYDPSVRELVSGLIDRSIARLEHHIHAGQRAGFVDPAIPAAEVAAWLTWMAERGLHQLVRDADDAAVTRLIDGYAAIVWNTLYAPTR
jgi:AcrR family transcriptional regulator